MGLRFVFKPSEDDLQRIQMAKTEALAAIDALDRAIDSDDPSIFCRLLEAAQENLRAAAGQVDAALG